MHWLDLEDTRERLLGRCLRQQAEALPDADFLVEGESHYSYGRVNELVNGFARGFRECGVQKGDTVSLFMESGSDVVFCALALNKLGAIWTPVNTDYKGAWLRETFEDGGARLLVADAALLPRVAELEGLAFERVLVRGRPETAPPFPAEPLEAFRELRGEEPDDATLHYGDATCILWTSGTTGRAKGVVQNHNVWIRAAVDGAVNTRLQKGDRIYSCLPMYHTAAWVANVFRALVTGIPCAMDPRFSASEFWNRTRYYDATMVFTLGAMHMFLWNAPERDDDAKNPVRVAGMVPMPEDLIPRFKARFGIEEIHQGYGQSEAMSALSRRPGRSYKPNSLGEPTEGVEARLLDDEDREVAVGEPGELCLRPTEPFALFNGYWRNPEATVSAWRNLWYHTGDLMRRDEDGELFFVDRKNDFIRYKGRNISSFAVEAAVGAHPAVLQCAAHGIPSAELEHEAEVKVCVVRKPGAALEAEELCRFVNETAPYFFVPRYVEFLDELPQTPTNRVQKYKLRERGLTPETWDARTAGFEVKR